MEGDTEALDACLSIFWLALRHPSSGQAMQAAVSQAHRRDGRAHITFHAGADRGIAFALSSSLIPLKEALDVSKEAGAVLAMTPTLAARWLPR